MLLLLSPRCIWYNQKIISRHIRKAMILKKLYFLLTVMVRVKDLAIGSTIYILALELVLMAQNGLTMFPSRPTIILFWNIFFICHRLQLIKMKTNIYYFGIMNRRLLQKRSRVFITTTKRTISDSLIIKIKSICYGWISDKLILPSSKSVIYLI